MKPISDKELAVTIKLYEKAEDDALETTIALLKELQERRAQDKDNKNEKRRTKQH